MMMKGLLIQQKQQLMEENCMSNLTSASGEASTVSSNQQQSSIASPIPNSAKKKRNLPGNPDPESEVIALTPKTLMATNRFLCEVCNKGFQRDQNLQLHRRGHNLPWKLKQRSGKELMRKKVYVCPEASCVHHDPSRALGDLTGIKKHFSRKHGEKKWKCDKCSKKYAVQSDWKAHSKICGTREYKCDCGTLFSRRDSFITHRAFCDALAEESARSTTTHHPLLFSQPIMMSHVDLPSSLYSRDQPAVSAAHMSATALLQKAAQMGATISRPHLSQMAPAHTSAGPPLEEDMAMMGFDGSFEGLMGLRREEDDDDNTNNNYSYNMENFSTRRLGDGGDEEMTRDFLGMRTFSHRDILKMAVLDPCSPTYEQSTKKPWQL